ncbi:Complement receptor type [Dirofilaria immitis]
MLIRFEYFSIFLSPLFATTTTVAISTCEDITTTSSGSVMYMEADYKMKHAPGTAALMACKFGYVSSLPFLVFCQTNGTWNHKLGDCVLTNKACSPQNTESNVVYMPPEISDIYPSGTFAMLHCSIGQLPVGPSSAMCLDGKWNTELGYCRELHSEGVFSGSNKRHNILISDFDEESDAIDTATINAEEKSIITNVISTEVNSTEANSTEANSTEANSTEANSTEVNSTVANSTEANNTETNSTEVNSTAETEIVSESAIWNITSNMIEED